MLHEYGMNPTALQADQVMMMRVVCQLVCFSSVTKIQFVYQSVVEQASDFSVDGGFMRTLVFGKTGHQLFGGLAVIGVQTLQHGRAYSAVPAAGRFVG